MLNTMILGDLHDGGSDLFFTFSNVSFPIVDVQEAGISSIEKTFNFLEVIPVTATEINSSLLELLNGLVSHCFSNVSNRNSNVPASGAQ